MQDKSVPLYGPDEALALLSSMLKDCATPQSAAIVLEEADRIATGHLAVSGVRLALLRLRDKAGSAGLASQWLLLQQDHPNDAQVLRAYARYLAREEGIEGAVAMLERCLPDSAGNFKPVLLRAEILADLHLYEQSTALFRELLGRDGRREVRVAFAKRLHKQGLIADAMEVMRPVMDQLAAGSMAAALAATLSHDYDFYHALEPDGMVNGQDVKLISMKHALLRFRSRTPAVLPERRHAIALITGSLGAGGAERQLSRLACHLKQLASAGPAVDERQSDSDGAKVDTVEVLVKQYRSPQGPGNELPQDFFLKPLTDMAVGVTEISTLPAILASQQSIEDPTLLRLLEQLPPQVHYGVTRLAPYLRARRFDVVSLWQDGTCLFGALAALLAGVPVIQLVFRGLPPNIRRMRYRSEYPVLYRALAEVPGVVFVSNSKAAADEYAKWLDIPRDRFQILYNGVPEVPASCDELDQAKWADFAQRTSDATETIGGVFRLEPDKRPLLWIKMMHRYLKRRPNARFFIVGNGRLYEQTRELAATLGVEDRLLLVGHSVHVGFWYSKMDAKVLLSSFEGLPNVLIEAQLMGVGTVSTPAGGSGECFIDGRTGHLLARVDEPDLEEACDKISHMLESRHDADLAEQGKHRARALFSVDAMVARFLDLCRFRAAVQWAPGSGLAWAGLPEVT
ncbi:glycosyltransferase [Achromobacter seleniivolatilans]|uniref:Glycosyltransferase n=1 Tax=Achromobacter seleniivolatilans TaxID=3047478 RepID=A0ABY9M1C9_9BURK|nr:glycosyltransferase [Achromobacter sp. R39]WMD20797.1 glycosyltransferase [Achromobacter sp. R39]